MLTTEQEKEKKNRLISGTGTSIFFVLLTLFLWSIKFAQPDEEELPDENEVEVTLDGGMSGGGGTPGSGGAAGDEAPSDASMPQVPQMAVPAQSTEQTNDPSATAVKKTSNIPNNTQKTDGPPQMTDDEKLAKAMADAAKNKTKGGGTGSGPDFGDGGTGGGTGGGNGPGNGPGNGSGPGGLGSGGVTHNLGNRRLDGYKKVKNDCNASGTVKLEVVVQPDGKITSIDDVPGYDDNLCLVNKAKQILRGAYFEAITGSKVATGQITISFKLQ